MSDLNLINTLQLKIFVTVAEERTLKAAAVKIGQTPSAISQNIKALASTSSVFLLPTQR
ncbi:LysR family transcriptional regulator [Parasutterella excrementihominis]|uniref:LysR family transcriptional regulator n=1 Tax=Parasutterella excrementihominis TaxID=487175 RepID=UPI0035143773